MSLQLAVATEDFGSPLKPAISQAAECVGIRGLRLNVRTEVRAEDFSDTALRQLSLYVTERQLKIAGLMFPSRHALHDPTHLDQRLDGIRTAMPLARKLGTAELLIRCGRIPDPESTTPGTAASSPTNADVNSLTNPFSFAPKPGLATQNRPADSEQFAMLCDILNDLVRFGNHIGCVLQLQFAEYDLKRIQRLLNEVKAGPVGLVFDPATAVMTGSSPVSVFRELYHAIGYIRARDARTNIDGAGIEVPVGDGIVDWTELLPTISEADYNGWICIERSGGDQRADDVRRGVSRVNGLLNQYAT